MIKRIKINNLSENKALVLSFLMALLVWLGWYQYTVPQSWTLLRQHWEITLTMIFGSFIAGATSEGGGAIAFPVFTKALHIASRDAKIFSLAIQSIGMSAASVTILLLRIKIAWPVIIWASLGGIPGIMISSGSLAPIIPAELVRLSFTAMVSGFAVTLAVLNWNGRNYNDSLPVFTINEKAITLLAGFCGGIMSGLVGNGIDIICFSVMVLLFRISEKIATPTSVVLMAFNALVGFLLHALILQEFTAEIKHYWLAAVPVVVLGAPLGAYLCSRLNNQTIATVLIVLIVLELITSLWVIQLNMLRIVISGSLGLLFMVAYLWMARSKYYISD